MPTRTPRQIDFLSLFPGQVSHYCPRCGGSFFTRSASPSSVRCPHCHDLVEPVVHDQQEVFDIRDHIPFINIPPETFGYDINYDNNNDISALDSFPVKQVDPDAICPICKDEVGTREVVELACGHWFDKTCIGMWLLGRKTCPVCRARVNLDAPGTSEDPVVEEPGVPDLDLNAPADPNVEVPGFPDLSLRL